MQKLLIIFLSLYAIIYALYFVYTLFHVTYNRKEFSKQDLSDGPLVLKEGMIVGKKHTGNLKSSKISTNKKEKHKEQNESKTLTIKNTTALDKDFINVTSD
ncbi:hypothetical protein DICVIV_10633 [Dictyocaulus viviparus]|uniref:Uncharacterized protein n=1 Tax=Dictyocaulus viviparus TaxID=29172 RepID=A0A0D8XHU9_DICVI|nr:hypothetical protein DICVIV_10633 [Dictyocaulus viviparus]